MTDKIKNYIRKSEELIKWLDAKVDGLEFQSNDRNRLVAGCLEMVREHQKSIVLLVANSLYGSAAALIRLEFEAYVRGAWFLYCAVDGDISKFKKDEFNKGIGELIEDLEKDETFCEGTLSYIKKKSWNTMCGLTHCGIHQVIRRSKGDEITPNYSNEELMEMLDAANAWGFLAAISVMRMANNTVLASAILEQIKSFFPSET